MNKEAAWTLFLLLLRLQVSYVFVYHVLVEPNLETRVPHTLLHLLNIVIFYFRSNYVKYYTHCQFCFHTENH